MFKNLRKLRESRGMTQRQLAAALGTSQQNIYNYENCRTAPGFDLLIRMAEYFDVSLDYLILDDAPEETRDRGAGRSETG